MRITHKPRIPALSRNEITRLSISSARSSDGENSWSARRVLAYLEDVSLGSTVEIKLAIPDLAFLCSITDKPVIPRNSIMLHMPLAQQSKREGHIVSHRRLAGRSQAGWQHPLRNLPRRPWCSIQTIT